MPYSKISRRAFVKSSAVVGAMAVGGCASLLKPDPVTIDTELYRRNAYLHVDMHCHLLNMRDVHAPAFLWRRGHGYVPENVVPAVGSFGYVATQSHRLSTSTATEEHEVLSALRKSGRIETDKQFIEFAHKEQGGYIFADGDTQLSGMFSNRARNAARLMEIFPQVNIFTPAMVDFYEGNSNKYGSLYERALVHRDINLLTRGRFLPLICFSPERQYYETVKHYKEPTCHYYHPLELVKFAIERMGFIGVKIHPSAGFSPYRNKEYGCPNTSLQRKRELTDEEAEHYDASMKAVYKYCQEMDVPILTHSGTSITSNKDCMHPGHSSDNPPYEEWTNNPLHWLSAIDEANRDNPELTPLRVCLAHFAGHFLWDSKHEEWFNHPFLNAALEAMKSDKGIYIDISIMEGFFDKSFLKRRAYKKHFIDVIRDNPAIAARMMYGTDWHMPTAAGIGERYLPYMRDLMNEMAFSNENVSTKAVMGGTAVDFFGLRKNQSNRKRLEKFYKEHGVTDVDWMRYV